MAQYLRAIINILLLLTAFQAFGLNTAECAAMSKDGSVTVSRITHEAERCFEAGPCHYGHKAKPGNAARHHKVFKKYFPGKTLVSRRETIPMAEYQGLAIFHCAAATGYQFLYFKSINPPPPKA